MGGGGQQLLSQKIMVVFIHLKSQQSRRMCRVATVREKYLENEIFSRSGKSQGILWVAREI